MTTSTIASAPNSADPAPWQRYDRLVRQAGLSGLTLLLLLGVWLMVRRWSGALTQPLDPAGFIVTGLILGLWSVLVRRAWYSTAAYSRDVPGRSHADWTRHVFGIVTAVGVLAFGVGLSLPGSSVAGLVAFWCLVLGTNAAERILVRIHHAAGGAMPETDTPQMPATGTTVATASRMDLASAIPLAEFGGEDDAEDHDDELLASDELQRISRVRDPHSGEVVSGLVRCRFDPGQRQQDVHLAFCPPLKKVTHFSCEQVEGPTARIRPSLVETFGVGLEVKLTALSSEPTSVQIQFFACEELLDGGSH